MIHALHSLGWAVVAFLGTAVLCYFVFCTDREPTEDDIWASRIMCSLAAISVFLLTL